MKFNTKQFLYDGFWTIWTIIFTLFLIFIVINCLSFEEYNKEQIEKWKQCDYALNNENRTFQGTLGYNFVMHTTYNDTFACCLRESRIIDGVLSEENCKVLLEYKKAGGTAE